MAHRSGSAKLGLLLGVGILCLLAITKPILATEYTVGDAAGWSFNVENWPNGKSFKAGDVLAFNYDKAQHNVAVVSKEGYHSCKASSGSKVYKSGHDQITLVKGQSYYICTFPGHCDRGMKIAINAT
ncbi:basic blue protein-like [Chenopodium quinoa]|uniref:basic blue protein-like n=1 Tax=Chenopodium quinoa TaxID=63459 RepID=UPI000B76DAF7|nr:basic blue protein-like [Chenopodium quinoa]